MIRTIVLASCLLSPLAFAQERVQKVIASARDSAKAETNLRVLTDVIGGRVPGTPAMDKAIAWAVTNFKDAGADSVATEPFQMSMSWVEGPTRVQVVAPTTFSVRVVSLAWTPAYAASSVEIVDVGPGDDAGFKHAKPGAVLLVHSETMKSWEDLFGEYMRARGIVNRALKAKAAALAFISTREHDLLYRHINGNTLAKIPGLILAREDGERIARLLEKGTVKANFSVPNKVGPAFASSNVVAEVRGAELPNEFVVLGAHLDSWELGTGALDNGCNATLVIEALRAIKKSGLKPRRTIKFVLYSGEEEGMVGSGAWARLHRGELDHAIADIVFDTGTGPITGFSLGGRKELIDRMKSLTAPVRQLGVVEMTTDAFVGTDNLHLLLEGVPTLVSNHKEDNYLENYHASSDTFDKVNLARLKDHIVVAAATAFAIADDPQRLGKRQSVDEVEALIKETGLDEQIELFNLSADWEDIKVSRMAR
jgi:carboxypeptidase Q